MQHSFTSGNKQEEDYMIKQRHAVMLTCSHLTQGTFSSLAALLY